MYEEKRNQVSKEVMDILLNVLGSFEDMDVPWQW